MMLDQLWNCGKAVLFGDVILQPERGKRQRDVGKVVSVMIVSNTDGSVTQSKVN